MDTHISTTPFGRRKLTLAQVAAQAVAKSRRPEQAVHKWAVFRDICVIRARLGISERALTVLDALLSFHPETALTGSDLVVFPSNQQLSLRARGMTPATLRRHLAVLVEAGLIVRRDSPNGKRFARKDREGEIAVAFGFDLAPLVVRAAEFALTAQEIRDEAQALRSLRETLTIARRDIAKMIAIGMEEGVSVGLANGLHDWPAVNMRFRSIVARIPRTAVGAELEPLAAELRLLASQLTIALEEHVKSKKISASESQNEQHKQNSKPHFQSDSEPGQQNPEGSMAAQTSAAIDPDRNGEDVQRHPAGTRDIPASSPPILSGGEEHAGQVAERGGEGAADLPARPGGSSARGRSLGKPRLAASTDPAAGGFPLGLVREACPDLGDYAPGGVKHWHDVLGAVAVVRPVLGISVSAWEEAREVMGEIPAAIVIACILQRADAIASPGGYLRDLTAKAAIGAFSIGPMLMALASTRQRERRQRA